MRVPNKSLDDIAGEVGRVFSLDLGVKTNPRGRETEELIRIVQDAARFCQIMQRQRDCWTVAFPEQGKCSSAKCFLSPALLKRGLSGAAYFGQDYVVRPSWSRPFGRASTESAGSTELVDSTEWADSKFIALCTDYPQYHPRSRSPKLLFQLELPRVGLSRAR